MRCSDAVACKFIIRLRAASKASAGCLQSLIFRTLLQSLVDRQEGVLSKNRGAKGSNESSPFRQRAQNGQNGQEWLFISAKYQSRLTTKLDHETRPDCYLSWMSCFSMSCFSKAKSVKRYAPSFWVCELVQS